VCYLCVDCDFLKSLVCVCGGVGGKEKELGGGGSKRDRGRSHLQRSILLTEWCYWLSITHSSMLSYVWSVYTSLVEEWTYRMSCAVKLSFSLFFQVFFSFFPFHVQLNKYQNVNIKWIEELY